LADECRSIPAQDLALIRLSRAFAQLDLFGAPFFGGCPEFGRDRIRIDEFVGKAGTKPKCRKRYYYAKAQNKSDRHATTSSSTSQCRERYHSVSVYPILVQRHQETEFIIFISL
jgi:hypothetical protein